MTEDLGFCLFCNTAIELTKGRKLDERGNILEPGRFCQAWITKIEIKDCFGLISSHEGEGSMFICENCRKRMHDSIINNAGLARQ